MDEQVVPGRLFTPAEVAIVVEERDRLRRELQDYGWSIESLTAEVQRLNGHFQVRDQHVSLLVELNFYCNDTALLEHQLGWEGNSRGYLRQEHRAHQAWGVQPLDPTTWPYIQGY